MGYFINTSHLCHQLTPHVSGRMTFFMSILARFVCNILLVFTGVNIYIPLLLSPNYYFIEYPELKGTHKQHLASWDHPKFKPHILVRSALILFEIKSFTLLLFLTTRKNYSIWTSKIESYCYYSTIAYSNKHIAKPPLTYRHLLIMCGYITKVRDASQGIFGLVILIPLTKCCKQTPNAVRKGVNYSVCNQRYCKFLWIT